MEVLKHLERGGLARRTAVPQLRMTADPGQRFDGRRFSLHLLSPGAPLLPAQVGRAGGWRRRRCRMSGGRAADCVGARQEKIAAAHRLDRGVRETNTATHRDVPHRPSRQAENLESTRTTRSRAVSLPVTEDPTTQTLGPTDPTGHDRQQPRPY